MPCWPHANFYFSVNHKITLRIDWKNLQFTVDQRHYWPKVPNILHTYLLIQNVNFLLLWDIFARNLLEKVPHHVQGSKISWISGHQGSQCVMRSGLKVYFHSDSLNFHTYLCTKRTFISYIFRPTKHTFITYLFRLTKCTVNNCT